MQAETGNNEALYGFLRKLGTSRESGSVTVSTAKRSFSVSMYQGKIVGIQEAGVDSAQTIAMLLVDAGCVVEQVLDLVRQAKVSVEQLQQILVAKQFVEASEFERASKTYELNVLYKLREPAMWQMEFSHEGRDPRRTGGISVSPAQLLLDIAELDADEERFQNVFGGLHNADRTILRATDPESVEADLSELEKVIWDVVGADGCPPMDVVEMSLLSDYAIIEGLLALLDRGAITVDAPACAGLDEKADVEVGAFFDEAEAEPEQSDVVKQVATRRDRAVSSDVAPDEFPPEFEPDGNKWSEREKSTRFKRSFLLRTLNYRMLEPRVLQRAVLVVSIAYLAALAILAPALFDAWFKALSQFTLGLG